MPLSADWEGSVNERQETLRVCLGEELFKLHLLDVWKGIIASTDAACHSPNRCDDIWGLCMFMQSPIPHLQRSSRDPNSLHAREGQENGYREDA